MMKKTLAMGILGGLAVAAIAGSATAAITRHPLAQLNPNVYVFGFLHAVPVECAPQGSDEFTTAAITNNTGATIPKGTTIYWADKFKNGATGAPKGHTPLIQDVPPNQTALVGFPVAGNGYTCTATFIEVR